MFKLCYLKRLGACGVAEELGGKPVSTQNPNEARFYEIVEETAREFDVPAPSVYVLRDERGINACVIGGDPESSAILATAGAIRLLDRDELQGVVAHEFGHLLNGDVKTNMGLIWALAGLQSLTFYALEWIRQTGNDERGGNAKEGIGVAIFAGLGLIVGLPGFVLAAIVRAAISRPQERLADKAAVEFTRKPLALAGALKKMGGASRGAAVESPRAWETSHLFFGSIWADGSGRVFRTHPRLNARILALDPNFDGEFPTLDEEAAETGEARDSETKAKPGTSRLDVKTLAEALVATLDGRTPKRLDGVEATLGEIPEEIERSLADFDGARTVVFALLLDRHDREVRRRQLETIRRSEADDGDADDVKATERAARVDATARAFGDASFSTRAAVVRLAIPALKLGTLEEYERFRATADVLCNADGRIDLFEFALRRSAICELDVWFGIKPPPVARYGSFGCVNLSTRTALTYLAARGAEGVE
ncbi:MAG: M48 family metalloprotease, partial [Thermoguttaceae bacterium]|nr:M48 family metalloprotease [Thermoguttaceae bacterium]